MNSGLSERHYAHYMKSGWFITVSAGVILLLGFRSTLLGWEVSLVLLHILPAFLDWLSNVESSPHGEPLIWTYLWLKDRVYINILWQLYTCFQTILQIFSHNMDSHCASVSNRTIQCIGQHSGLNLLLYGMHLCLVLIDFCYVVNKYDTHWTF